MFRSILTSSIALSILASASIAAAGLVTPLDLTGTWAGSYKCKLVNPDGTKTGAASEFAMRVIVSEFGTMSAEFDAPVVPPVAPRGGDAEGLCGVATATKPGSGIATLSVIGFGGTVFDPEFPVVGISFRSAKTFPEKNGVSGKLKGSSIVPPYFFGVHGTCKVKFVRTSTATPTIDPDLIGTCEGI